MFTGYLYYWANKMPLITLQTSLREFTWRHSRMMGLFPSPHCIRFLCSRDLFSLCLFLMRALLLLLTLCRYFFHRSIVIVLRWDVLLYWVTFSSIPHIGLSSSWSQNVGLMLYREKFCGIMRRISKIGAEIAETMGGLCYTFKATVGVRCFQILFHNNEHLNISQV